MRKKKPDRLVTIARFASVADADLAKTILATSGIEAALADLHSRLLAPHAVRYVRLQVMEPDAKRAIKILQQSSDRHPLLKDNIARLPQCPNCGLYDVSYGPLSRSTAIVSWLLLGFPLLFVKKRWRCSACGHQWRA